jgi:hypothetical protein
VSGWELATYKNTNDESEGGNAAIYWTVNGVAQPVFDFSILGEEDPSSTESTVDGFYGSQGAPWFWGNILDYESTGGRQYTSDGSPPLVVSDPDGIGISQIDGTQNSVNDFDYWNYEANIYDGLSVLKSKGTESGSDWRNQYNASAGNGLSDQYCSGTDSFQYNLNPLGDHSFGDADWIQDYNSHSDERYYLWWTGTQWDFKFNHPDQPGYNYVPNVCDSASY